MNSDGNSNGNGRRPFGEWPSQPWPLPPGGPGLGRLMPVLAAEPAPPPISQRPVVADEALVRQMREAVATRLERADNASGVVTGADEQARARHLLAEELDALAARRAAAGRPPWPVEAEIALRDAVWSALFGLGRLQPLLDREDVENIHIHGHDHIALELADGSIQWWPHPVADSDDDLIELLASLAARMGQTSREFSAANPVLNLRLPAGGPLGSRLAAVREVTGRPTVAIRRHRLTDIGLDDLVRAGSLDEAVRDLLRAAVRAGKNLIVSGGPAAGKTTLLRALAGEIPAREHVVTVEDEYELGLHLDRVRHPLVTALEARNANAEGAGEISLDDLLKQVLRHSPARVLVGEVRAGEVTAMLRALGNGAAGGMCTLHATSAHAVFDRIASLGQLASPPLPISAAYRWTASAINLVVHVRKTDQIVAGQSVRERFVSEVVEVGPVGDSGRPDTTTVFAPRPLDGRAVPAFPPSPQLLADLQGHGFDRAWFDRPDGAWNPAVLRRDLW